MLIAMALIAVFSALAAGVLSGLNNETQRALAHGNDSPDECKASGVGELSVAESATEAVINAGSGKVVDWLCIKSGNNTFGDKQHSQKITADGSYGNDGCFIVEGLGTAQAKVKEKDARGCKDISHVDYKLKDAPASAKVSIKKSASTSSDRKVGDTFKFILELKVDDAATTAETQLEDLVPDSFDVVGVAVVSSPSSGSGKLACGYVDQDVDCTLASGAPKGTYKVEISVQVGGVVCGKIKNTAVITGDHVKNGTASDDSEITIKCKELTVCKKVIGNDNGIDEGGVFTISVTGQPDFTPHVMESHSGSNNPECKKFNVAEDALVTLEEVGVPDGWGHASGYPRIDLDWTSNDPANGVTSVEVKVSGNRKVTFENKSSGVVLPTGKVIVKKAGKDIPADLLNTNFGGTVTGVGVTHNGSWTASVGGVDVSNDGLADGDYQVLETGMPMNVTGGQIVLVGYKEYSGDASCSTNPGDYTNDGKVSIDDNTKTVCVMNKFVAAPQCVDYTYNSDAVKNFITNSVDKNGTAWAKLSENYDGCTLPKVRFSLYELTGPSWNDYTQWQHQVHIKTQSKELVKGQKVEFDLRPFALCNYQLDLYLTNGALLNPADPQNVFGQGTGEVTQNGWIFRPAPHHTPSPNVLLNGGAGKAYHIEQGNVCGRTINVCKFVTGNGDQVANGGTFTFNVTWDGGSYGPFELTVDEMAGNGAIPSNLAPATDSSTFKCQRDIPVPANKTVTVTETLPGGWVNYNATYPAHWVRPTSGGSGTWTFGSSSAALSKDHNWVTFKNRAKVTETPREIKVCKVMVGNGDLIDNGGTFSFTVSGIAQPIELTVIEPATNGAFGTRVCSDPITVPAGEVTVTETADRPADWPGDHPAAPVPYPSYHRSTAAYPGAVGDWTGGSSVTFTPNTDASKNTITFKNRAKPTRELEICKVVVGNGDGAVDGGVFKFDITGIDAIELVAYEPAGDATNGTNGTEVCKTVRVANTAVTVTEWEARPPTYDWEGSWNGDAPLFPQNSVFGLGQQNGTANVPADVNKVTFYNKTNPRNREIIIEKFFLNLGNYQLAPGDWPNFVPNPPIEGWTFAANCTELLNGIDPNHRAWSCKVPASWDGDIEEELDEDRWEQVQCDFPEAQRIAEVFTFCNTPVTRVTVIKQFVGDFTGETFTFSNTNLPGPVANAPGGNSNQVQVFDSLVEPDSFSVTENEFLTQSEGCFGDDAEGYHTVYSIVKNGVTIATQVEGDTANFTAGPGDEVIVTFINARCGILSSPQIVIQKFNDPAGNRTGTNGLAGFQFRVFNNGVELPGSPFLLGAGPLLIPGLNPGTVEVLELDPNTGGWVLTGSKTDLGDNGSFEFEVGGQPAARNIDFGEIIRFNFYNQPRVNITVSKTIFNNANPQGANGGAGWTFTLSGCGVGPDQQTTGASGSVSWTNLPPAVNCTYTVTETAKAGWVADQISYNTSPNQPGQTANLTFINRQIEGCQNINDCREIESTPTPTPTTPPTSTPVPGETPTTPPDETPAASPTPEETVAGEQTPGPGQPTPIAPSTGAGFGIGGAAGFNLLLVIAGLIAISGGFSFIALGRRSANRR